MKFKKYGGILPFGICSFLLLTVFVTEKLMNVKLRNISQMILLWSFILSAIFMFFLLCKRLLKAHPALKMGMYVILTVLSCIVIYLGLVVSTFKYTPEHIVERNGIKMTACVDSFLQKTVYYYEYKNILFRGAEIIGYEDYGNGSGDPLDEESRQPNRWYFKDLEGNQLEVGGEN